jgi:hypothetical protein
MGLDGCTYSSGLTDEMQGVWQRQEGKEFAVMNVIRNESGRDLETGTFFSRAQSVDGL